MVSALAIVGGFLAFLLFPVVDALLAMALFWVYEAACDALEPAPPAELPKQAPPQPSTSQLTSAGSPWAAATRRELVTAA